jgi:hypothetical protein
MFLVKCPKCKHNMKYQPKNNPKTKKCVYCNHSFKVNPNINKSRIVKKI